MTKIDQPIVFFGNERLATGVTTSAPTLRMLLEGGHNIVCVVSHNEATNSRTQRELEVAEIAKQYGIPVLLPSKPHEIIEELKAYRPAIGVLVAYGKIVPQSVIDIFPHGILNIHPSLLPFHRGPIPLEAVMLDGSAKTGVSLMSLAKDMDAGPVYAQTEVNLTGEETKQELADRLIDVGASMVCDLLPEILEGSVVALPQDDDAATFDGLIVKNDGILDWRKPAEQLAREVRAYAGWPGSKTKLAGKDVVITKAHIRDGKGELGTMWREGKSFGIYTAQDILMIDLLKPAGKAEMEAAAFLNGYGSNL